MASDAGRVTRAGKSRAGLDGSERQPSHTASRAAPPQVFHSLRARHDSARATLLLLQGEVGCLAVHAVNISSMPDNDPDAPHKAAIADSSPPLSTADEAPVLLPALANHRRIVILYGSQSGCAAELASRLALDAFHHLFPWCAITVLPLDAFDPSLLSSTPLLLIVTSTQGQGEPPDNARRFYRLLMRRGLPSSLLSHLHYSVFGLGDSSYPIFNAVARRLHQRLQEVGAVSICRRGLGDDQEADGGVEKGWEEWRAELWQQLRRKLGWLSQLSDDDIDRTRWPPSRYIVELEGEEQGGGADERKKADTADALQATEEERKDAAPPEKSAAATPWCNDACSLPPPAPPSLSSSSALPVALPPVSLPPFGTGSNRYVPFPALLSHNTRLTPESHFQDVRHLRFALPAALPASSPASASSFTPLSSLLSFEPGNVVEIFPRNDPAVVSAFITSVLGLSSRSFVRISLQPSEEDEGTGAEQELSLPSRCSLQCLFELHLDLCGTPKASFFSLLALHAADAMQREKLHEWGSTAEGRADLFAYCERERRTYAEVLTEFWSARPPLSLLVFSIPRLQPRAFSISSSHRLHARHLDVTAAILQFETKWKRRRTGLCSRFLQLLPHTPYQQPATAAAEQGAPDEDEDEDASIGPALSQAVYVPIFIRRGAMSMPKELGWGGRPVVMVGPGTGVAPFRAMCQHKQAALLEMQGEAEARAAVTAASSASPAVPPSLSPYSPFLLLAGCRYRAADFLYASEWRRFHSSPPQVLSHPVLTAFSRDQAEKVYVQDVMRSEEVSRLLYDWLVLRSGFLFVAGSSGAMPREVRRAVVQVIEECGGVTNEQAVETVRRMEKEKRYIQDTW